MWEEISLLARQEGITILLTTHYLEEADRLVRRLAIIDRGRVVAAGSPEELKSRMGSDTIVVELRDAGLDGNALRVLERVPGVREIAVDGRWLRARAEHAASTMPAVLSALDSEEVPVAAVTVARPSLDDVYLRYAGRAFDRADREGTQ
jgi:ABC-2 type transport system ATP-binding protein